ncbi:type II toxin-antitoxin system Phd/YefM family antitoxin [Shewanella baltica]|uniref:Antitoxin n=1 Tax=Shewanella baltica (strain OS155 / ATCC BAA-1091) TaxID=325240 RepID=A3DB70_SHEB5|nr:type II toxin-antitoxin system Phd/YefM family antitoxin [Shewanella baltica]ABN63983.1 prevent-host-death family protein [Shewanella baltica OS155]AEH16424.1 prevent-host-death family protein [Shewanella baltica OS117]
MAIYSFTEVRSNFKSICDTVVNDCEPVVIHRRGNENVVLFSESEFNSWKETLYLLSNPANAKRLLESIKQVNDGHASEHELSE